MATKIVTKNSSTAGSAPSASDLVQGELAVNVVDKRLYTEDNAGNIVELGTNPLGEITANGGIALGDSDKATFGAGDDLQIYHDGSNSYIQDAGTGSLNIKSNGSFLDIQSDSTRINNAANSEIMATFVANGAVSLYHDNSTKLATTATGIAVTGTGTFSDNLLVGKSATAVGSAGAELQNGSGANAAIIGTASVQPLILNRLSTDGTIADFLKDGTTVGSIGTVASRLFIGNDDVFLTFQGASDRIYPASSSGGGRDNAIDLGDGGARFKDIYATNGTIQTSDAREKTAVRELTDAEMRVAKKLSKNIGFFQWLTAIEKKGEDARSHCGQTVQGVIAEFDAEGLDAFDYAMVCYNSWEAEGDAEAGDRFSLRTDQLNHFMIRGLAQSQEALEARLSALET